MVILDTNQFDDYDNDDDEDAVDIDVEEKILSIDFNKKEYRKLEELIFENKSSEIWKVVKKYLSNEQLCKYIYAYRQAQVC